MKLFHTSPNEISTITSAGRFGSFLFFSARIYTMTAGEAVVYSLEIDDDSIVEAGRLFYHEDAARLQPLVDELAARLDIEEATAEALIEESMTAHDLAGIDMEDAGDLSWDVQHFTARAAALLGYRGVAVRDEQGTSYLIDMAGREADLVRV
ncbi:hypothetical protein AVE30378_04860 [Achromobacter veterisilvae]|uniref:Uncharacterized protein n=1 Tax=Achromobacter veterisilvae TaxID=2069367 RepID=A0A446CVS9_9BURK|nr:hypothetical protein [Achromobacter veterisilvae]SSW71969.1 hypothetical protein AVE30378_04860 [Achromobacter veterisilvae]